MTTDFRELVDLASERLGGSVLYVTDDFFAEKDNILKPAAPVWREHEYTDRGKWMDGWESRRKRVPGHDFAVVRLGSPGVIRGLVVDTAHFRGNYPEHCSFEGCVAPPETSVDTLLSASTDWIGILPKSQLRGDSENGFAITSPFAFTHLRFNIYPDGGVARLRVHGEVVPEWHRAGGLNRDIDLAAVEYGGQVLGCSDMFFGPKHNLIMPGRARDMSDGWETKRRRGPGHDWVIVRLATEALIRRIEIDTSHFKGNYPDTCSIDASSGGEQWTELLGRTKMQADARHFFIDELRNAEPVTHVRLNVYPDGGVARLRVYGTATDRGRGDAVVHRINTRTDNVAAAELRNCCGSSEWVRQVMSRRPFANWAALSLAASEIWSGLSEQDWREAFAAHPRIGAKKSAARWSAQEQSGTDSASEATMLALASINRQYEQHFGYIYIVCATGRTADDLLQTATMRLENDPAAELRIAAEEQRKITQLRLLKLVT